MKHLILIIFILSQIAFAADKTSKTNEVKGGIVINDSLQKLIEIEGVKPIYEGCKTDFPAETEDRSSKILNCLWTGVSKKEDLKKKVQVAYEEQLKGKTSNLPAQQQQQGASRGPASTPKTNLTARVNNSSIDYGSDPAVIGLSKYYASKLDAILNPEIALTKEEFKKGIILATNHRKFIDLYKSELGKTIINAFTSYCLDVDPETCVNEKSTCSIDSDPDTRKSHREKNLLDLKKADLSNDGPDSVRWRNCITSVPKTCKSTESSANQDESTKRSCLIMDYVETARKNIIVADDQIKFYETLEKDKGIEIGGIAKSIDDPNKSSSDAILEISSEDVKTALKDPLAADTKEFEACYKDKKIVNEKACEKFLSTNATENEAAIAELGMRQLAQEATLETELASDKRVEDYLKEEGFTEKDIKTMTDKTNIEQTKAEILNRYKNKKQAIIDEMAKKIDAKSSSEDGKITIKDISKLQKIQDELASRSNDLAGMVKFNNIVSSYLQVSKEGSKKLDRNTASLFGEVKDLKKEDKEMATAQIDKAKLKENTNPKGDSQTNLDLTTINEEFLNYSTSKKSK